MVVLGDSVFILYTKLVVSVSCLCSDVGGWVGGISRMAEWDVVGVLTCKYF